MQQYCYHCMKPLDASPVCRFCGHSNEQAANAEPYHVTPGTLLSNRYLVGDSLGEGGFGITYIGMDTTLGKRVAIKEFYPSGAANRTNVVSEEVIISKNKEDFFRKGVARFLEEAKNVARFYDEEGIIDVLDYFEENNTAYIVMEFIDGKTLKDCVNQNGKFRPDKLIELLMPVMQSLAFIHQRGIIHRDISPDNLMLSSRGKMILMDFGSARYYTNEEREMSVILKQGFAPIEQYSRNTDQGPYTDVYALCATIYSCITGTIPVDSLDRMVNDTLQPPSRLGVPISPQQEAALMHGLAVKAADRTQSMDALIRELTAPYQTAHIPAQNLKQAAPVHRPAQAQPVQQLTPSYRPEQPRMNQATPSYRPEQPKMNQTTPSYRPEQPRMNQATPSYRPEQPPYQPAAPQAVNKKPTAIIIAAIAAVVVIAGAVVGIVLGTQSCSKDGGSASSAAAGIVQGTQSWSKDGGSAGSASSAAAVNVHQITGKTGVVLATDSAINTADADAQSKLESFMNPEAADLKSQLESNGKETAYVYVTGNTIVIEEAVKGELSQTAAEEYLSKYASSFNSSQAKSDTGLDEIIVVWAVVSKDNTLLAASVMK